MCQQFFQPKKLLALGQKVKCHFKCIAIRFLEKKKKRESVWFASFGFFLWVGFFFFDEVRNKLLVQINPN